MTHDSCVKLVQAYMLICNSDFIICDIVDSGHEATKERLSLLRDYLPEAEDALGEVIAELIGTDYPRFLVQPTENTLQKWTVNATNLTT